MFMFAGWPAVPRFSVRVPGSLVIKSSGASSFPAITCFRGMQAIARVKKGSPHGLFSSPSPASCSVELPGENAARVMFVLRVR